MWGPFVSLWSGGKTEVVNVNIDEYIGNLWVYLNSPAGPVDVQFTVDNADAAEIIIPLDFHSESTFQFTAINGGRFVGTGGNGASGGDDNGATGTSGNSGQGGGHAIRSDTFGINIDIDDGFLLGGGGGGGGGSYDDTGAGGTPGGGGGGGIGWGDATGGAAGSPTGSPTADAGTAGSQLAAGMGGDGGSTGVNNGGDGGGWGLGGTYGQFASPKGAVFGTTQGNGGSGGNGGAAFYPVNGATITFNGASGEPTLRIQSRIKGETDGLLRLPDDGILGFHVGIGHPSRTYGWTLINDGTLREVNTDSGNTDYSTYWYVNAVTAADYEVRAVAATEGGSWDSEPGAAGTWFVLSSTRVWSITRSTTSGFAQSLFEIRRTDETDPCASGLLDAGVEWEP